MSSSPALAAHVETTNISPSVLSRYTSDIARYLRANALPQSSLAGTMTSYHMGWIDAGGHSHDASPGKLVRPSLCLWACEASGGDAVLALPVAAALEWTHNFTLVHDDIQDGDRMRRHRETVWAIWGAPQGINAGDALHALAMRSLTASGPYPERQLRAARIIADATLVTVEGQCLDLRMEGRPEASVRAYLRVVGFKTGALLGASLQTGAVMSGASDQTAQRFRKAGELLGKAFQIRDDWLGVWGDTSATGKSSEGDVTRRKLTFPIVAAFSAMKPVQRERLRELFGSGVRDAGRQIRALLEAAGGPELTASAPQHYAARAIREIKAAGLVPARVAEFVEVAEYVAKRVR
ncbi:MAG: polyprenyl synthetase family protein [Candidatus Eremiobacteraeota bacterium]|nr:polyprenyl synthetase family protein [Candidatus Eremiobacteraeota bacterium]MBV8367023.1 polyprenyl synthetase family protein [Candidatus Eremiobacteraeota bacterium]